MGAPIRLQREVPVAGQAGRVIAIGIVLAVVGLAIITVMRSEEAQAGEKEWVVYAVGAGLGLGGVLMAVPGIRMLLMTRIPETIVEVDRIPVHAGHSFRMTVRQPGPIRLASLRVNLVCEQTTRQVRPAGVTRRSRDQRIIHQVNVLDLRGIAAGPGEHVVGHAPVNVPAAVPLADIEGRKEITWRIEVWGRVRGWADFGHHYVIPVLDR